MWVKNKKKKETWVWNSKFLKIEKRCKEQNWFQCMKACNYSTFIWYIVHLYSAMDGCTAINFVKPCYYCFCPSWHRLCCMLAFAELSQQRNNACIRTALCTTTQNLDEDSFDMLYKNNCWAAIPDPIWPMYHMKDKYQYSIVLLITISLIFFFTHTV